MLLVDRHAPDAVLVWAPGHRIDLRATLGTLRRGSGDPTTAFARDGALWRTSRMPCGPVSYRLVQRAPDVVDVAVWGPGTGEFVDGLPSLLGADDDPSGFAPEHALLREAHRTHPGLRIPRTGRVLEALVPAVLEQKVTGKQARAAWRWLLLRHGDPAPGPVAERMRVVPDAQTWRHVPSWDWHRAGVDPKRARTAVECARVAPALEGCVGLDHAAARERLRAVPGVGVWTAAEVAQRALGDADALSVGDYHLSDLVGWSLLGHPLDDDGMVELLAPLRPHRHRAVRLLELSPQAHKPRFGPRLTIQDHRAH